MSNELLVRATNRTAKYATVALVYWVFIFLTVTVLDLKIFKEKMTAMFILSLLGIFAVLGGAVILNVMANLSRVAAAASQNSQAELIQPASRRWLALMLLSFPLIGGALIAGDYLSAQRKKELLLASAERLIAENQPMLAELAEYSYSREYIATADRTLGVLNKIDKNFPEVVLIQPDAINGKKLFLGFSARRFHSEVTFPEKSEFIYSTTPDERSYLERVADGRSETFRFNVEHDNYQLYFPTTIKGKKLILYFSDFQRYGKFGS